MTKGGPLGPGLHRMVGALYTPSILRCVWRKHAKTQAVMHRSKAKVTKELPVPHLKHLFQGAAEACVAIELFQQVSDRFAPPIKVC